MTAKNYENMWNLLNKYQFEIDSTPLIDLTCVICKKIVRDCRQNLCGCRYCSKCVTSYLKGKVKMCPGSTSDCQNQVMNLSKNIQIDHVANMKVSRLLVKCPESGCQHRGELRNIEEHINSHNISCPYLEVGCDKAGLTNINIVDHFKGDELSHSTLLITSLQQLKNELTLVEEDSKQRTQTIFNTIQKEIRKLEKDNINQSELIEKFKIEISSLNEMYCSMKKSNQEKEELVKKLSQKIDTTNFQTETQLQRLHKQISEMSKTLNRFINRCPDEQFNSTPLRKPEEKHEGTETKLKKSNCLNSIQNNKLNVTERNWTKTTGKKILVDKYSPTILVMGTKRELLDSTNYEEIY